MNLGKKHLGMLLMTVMAIMIIMSSTVSAAPRLNKKKLTLYVGQTYTLKIKGFSGKVKWSSSKKKVVSVNNGKLKAKVVGTATITAKAGKKKALCKITVKPISLSSTKIEMVPGKTKTLTLRSGTKSGIKWSSSKPSVANIITHSKNKVVIKARKNGTTIIRAIYKKKQYQCKVIVKKIIANSTETNHTSEKAISSISKPGEKFLEGHYRVGSDIPAGEYIFYASGNLSGYYCESSDENKNNIINNSIFKYNDIYTLTNGNYVELKRCYAVPSKLNPNVDTSGEGNFSVGKHVQAGTYELVSTDSINGYYCIYDNSLKKHIVANDNFSANTFITVESGQIMKLSRCKIARFVSPATQTATTTPTTATDPSPAPSPSLSDSIYNLNSLNSYISLNGLSDGSIKYITRKNTISSNGITFDIESKIIARSTTIGFQSIIEDSSRQIIQSFDIYPKTGNFSSVLFNMSFPNTTEKMMSGKIEFDSNTYKFGDNITYISDATKYPLLFKDYGDNPTELTNALFEIALYCWDELLVEAGFGFTDIGIPHFLDT